MIQANGKTTVFIDCDDTILCSSKAVIGVLNKKYGTNKTEADIKNWGYTCIAPQLNRGEMFKIFESEEFWGSVSLNNAFEKIFKTMRKDFNWIVATKGTANNLRLKAEYIDKILGMGEDLHMIGFPIVVGENISYCKGTVCMKGGIQIDDRTDSLLGTNASVRVLLQNSRRVSWNQTPIGEDNFYVTDTWEEIGELLEFFKSHPEFINRTYGG